MTGRLASAFIAEAGKPQKIYTVPANKVFDGHIGVLNTIGSSASIEVKHGQGIVAPAATFPLSNAEQVADSGADRPGAVLFILDADTVVSMKNSATARSIDISNQLAPVLGVASFTGTPRNPESWGAADRLCMIAAEQSSEMRRYLGSVTPWTLGTYGSVTGGDGPGDDKRSKAGWGQYAIGFGQTAGNMSFCSTVPTSGSTTWSHDTAANLGLTNAYTSSWGYYGECFASNGIFFFCYAVSNQNYRQIAWLPVGSIGAGATWNILGSYINTGTYGIGGVFFANGAYYILYRPSGNNNRYWYKIASGDLTGLTTDMPAALVTNGVSMGTAGYALQELSLHQLDDGRIVWRGGSSQTNYVLDPATDTISGYVSDVGDTTTSGNYDNYHLGKLSPVDIGIVDHSVPRDGAADPDNDRIVYTDAGIYKFVTDETWSLKHVTDDAGWIDYNLSLADKAEVEWRGKMLNATDEIWVRSTQPNITVSVEGFLIDA